MPKQKDLKRLVRTRMQKTGEAYTAARRQLLTKRDPPAVVDPSPVVDLSPAAKIETVNYAELAGMSDAAVSKETGRTWTDWVRELDRADAKDKSHREIVALVSSVDVGSWWRQMVAVGYERIRGLRQRTQLRDGEYQASKSRTFNIPIEQLFRMFDDEAARKCWLTVEVTVRSTTPGKRMRILWSDGTPVQIGFMAKGDGKSAVAIQHEKLADKAAVETMKRVWGEQFDRLAALLE